MTADESSVEPAPDPVGVLPPGAPLVRARNVHKPWGWKQYILLGVGGMALIGLMLGLYIAVSLWPGFTPTVRSDVIPVRVYNKQNELEDVLGLKIADGDFVDDPELKMGLNVITAMRHRRDEFWFALTAEGFGLRNPRAAELVNKGIQHLEKYYKLTLELGENAEPTKFLGRPAHRIEFKGLDGSVVHRGELYMLANNGFGYWIFIAGPTLEIARSGLAAMQGGGKGLILVTERRGWREQPPPMATYSGIKHRYTVRAPDEVWEKFSALDLDVRGDLFLLGRYLKARDNRKNGSVLTLILGNQPSLKEAMKLGREYVEGKKKEENDTYRLEPLGNPRNADVGNRRGMIADFKVVMGDEVVRYLQLAVVNEPDYLFVWRAECRWEHRQIWQRDFDDLLATLQLPPKE